MKNVEIKASCSNPEALKKIIATSVDDGTATFAGIDHQIDTYFECQNGRLKLREGNIENFLIAYERTDTAGPKKSKYTLVPATEELKKSLLMTLKVKQVVDKVRAIYYFGNVKVHVDEVKGLGSFMEIEARDPSDTVPVAALEKQCEQFMRRFGVKESDLFSSSYSDMMGSRE